MPPDLALPGVGTFVAATPKHAPITAPEPIRDLRSVGELLLDADHLARTLLLDAEAQDAPGLLRSWADTVAVAADLVNTLAGREYAAADSQRVVERVSGLAASVSADLATARWPGAGSGDHRMRAISGNLGRARELVDKYGAEIQPHVPQVANDLKAARTRVVHTLYIATHGVVVALNRDGRQRATDPTPTATPRAGTVSSRGRYEVGPGVRWADRLGVAERALGSYLTPGRYADALANEQSAPIVGLPRLRDALAQFDIQAHRTLVDAPNAGNMVLTTRTQGMFLGAALALARAADETGQLEPSDTDSTRLRHGVNAAGEAWMGLARRWRDLMPQGARLDPALGAAAAQLRAACRELTRDGDHLAPAAAIAQRVDLRQTLPVIAHYLDAAAELAEATRPALRDPGLVAPIRAVVRRLAQDSEDCLYPDTVFVPDADLVSMAARGNPPIPLPERLRDALDAAASKAARASAAAATGAAATARHDSTDAADEVASPAAQRATPAPSTSSESFRRDARAR